MSRFLVTGANGFIGTNMVRALVARGDEVHAFVRTLEESGRFADIQTSIHFHQVDITEKEQVIEVVREIDPEYVFHLVHYGGNRGQSDEAMVRRVIIEGTAHLYEACEKAGHVKAIVNAGSSSEYGIKKEAMKEGMVPEPNTPYGIAKVWATLYGEHLRREKGMPITTLRLFNIYGPFEAGWRFFPAVILALLRKEIPTLANPETVRDFTYVDDVIEAFLLAIRGPFGVYNVGTSVQTSLKEAAELIRTEIRSETSLVWGGYPDQSFDSMFWRADPTLARTALGWEPRTQLAEGVHRTVEWFKENRHLYDQSK